MVQGINKEYIFKNEVYMSLYKRFMKEKLSGSNITILAYCIMNNHAHLLVYTEKIQYLGKFMQRLNTTYSNYYNKMEGRVGYVFRDRYKTQNIYSRKQLYNCISYIHNNPVKAGMVDQPYKYNYSSYNEFLGNKDIINEKSIELIFETTKITANMYDKIHKDNLEKNFLDVKEKDFTAIVKKYEEKYIIKIQEISKDRILLKSFLKEVREETNITLNELSKLLDISKSTVSKYSK